MAKVLGAAFRGKLSKLQKLLEEEDPSLIDCESVDYADEAGNTPLHAACQEGHADCVALLLRAGAIVDKPGAGGITALIVAAENGRTECVKHLLAAKASVKFADPDHGATALHGACQAGASDCVSALLDAKAAVDALDSTGASPLIIAAYRGHARCVELLMAAGADDRLEYEGKQALDLAEQAGHQDCVDALAGAVKPEELSKSEKKELAREKLAANPAAAAGAKALAAAESKMGPPPKTEEEQRQEDLKKAADNFEARPGEDMLSQLQRQLKEAGLGGAELIDEKKKELEAEQKQAEEADKKAKEAQAKKEAAKPKTATEAKERANALFSNGKVKAAAEFYELALELAEAELTNPDGSEADDPALATGLGGEPGVRAILYCNLAACRLRQRMWREAIDACDSACDIHGPYTKALYRRAQAKRQLRDYEGAMDDLRAAHEALCKAGDGKPVGEAGRKTAAELEKLAGTLKEEYAKEEKDTERRQREEEGITIGHVEEDNSKSVYYHYASQGEKTQDFMWFLRANLREFLGACTFERPEGFVASNGFPARDGIIQVVGFDPDPEGGDSASQHGTLEGFCTIRTFKGKRSLFFDIVMEVPWRGWVNVNADDERTLGGKTRLWNIAHHNNLDEWQHLNHRNTDEVGPWTDAIAEQLAPAMAARLKTGVQEVLGRLMFDKIDPKMFEGPPKPEKPKAASRAWGKGTTDYSKWDNLSDEEEEESRIEEIG